MSNESNDSPRCEWVRGDVREAFETGLRSMKAQADQAARTAPVSNYAVIDTIYLDVTRVPSKRNEPNRYRAMAVAGLPEGHTLAVNGTSVDDCIFEARHELLAIYKLTRLPGQDWKAIRDRVAQAKFEIFSMTDI